MSISTGIFYDKAQKGAACVGAIAGALLSTVIMVPICARNIESNKDLCTSLFFNTFDIASNTTAKKLIQSHCHTVLSEAVKSCRYNIPLEVFVAGGLAAGGAILTSMILYRLRHSRDKQSYEEL